MGTFDYCAYTLHFICDEEKKKKKKIRESVTMVRSKLETHTDGLLVLNYQRESLAVRLLGCLISDTHTNKKNNPKTK